MAKCYNKNLSEYQDLRQEFKNDIVVDSIISKWQAFKNTDEYPTVQEAKEYLNDAQVAFSLKTKDFADALLNNLSRKGLISWSNKYETYFVNNTRGEETVGNEASLEANLRSIYRYLEFNNIPKESVSLQKTNKSYKISIQDTVFSPKDILPKTRNAAGTHTNSVLAHLKRMFPQIRVAVVNVMEAENYYDSLPSWQKAKVPFNKVNSFYVDGQVVLIRGRVTNETAIEEVLHPFVDALFAENPSLFQSLLDEAKKNFPVLAQEIEEAYNTKYRKFTQQHRDLELVTQALTRHFAKEYENEPTKSFKDRVKDFLDWFANIIQDLYRFITNEDTARLKVSDIKATASLSDIAKLLNTSELEFRLEKAADRKVRYALSEDKQKAIDQIKSRGNTLQKQMVDKLLHIASTRQQEVVGLPASREDITQGDDIVILNEKDHTYYNLNDLSKPYVSATTAISGKLKNEDDVAMNLAVGNDFDKIVEGIALYKSFDEMKDQMEILNEEQARRAYNNLEGYISAIRSLGDIVIPQVVVHYNSPDGSNIAGTIDLLLITPQGKLKIIDLKTSKNKYSTSEDGKYNSEWDIGDDALLKAFGIDRLSTKQKHNLQVNLYKRMLENMGYQFDTSDHAVSTFHIWVDIEGKGKDQKFNGNFELENAVFHPIGQNKPYVDALVPRDKNIFSESKIKEAIRNDETGAILEDKDYLDVKEALRQAEGQDATEYGGIEMDIYYKALTNYREQLVTRREVIQTVKGTVFMDRSQEEAVERISTTIALATLALTSGETETKRIFTELLVDAKKELESYEKYLLDVNNAKNSDYITRARNYDNFVKTFEGLYLLQNSEGLNNTQKNLILSIQNTLNRLSASTPEKLSVVDEAIFNHVKAIVKEKSTKDFSTYTDPITGEEVDPFEKLFKEAVDISTVDYMTRDLNTSPDTLLAIMKKLWHQERQKVLDRIQAREGDIAMLGSRLARLSPGKSMKDIFSFMIELDENGNHTGRYVQKLGSKYHDLKQKLRSELTDEQGEWLNYIEIDDLSKARPQDIEYNKNLFAKKQAYANFLRAETLGDDKQPTGGEYHEYTQEWYDIRNRYQDFIASGENGMWVDKAGLSTAEKETFYAKHFNAVEVNSPIFKDGVFTGKTIKKMAYFPLKKYRVAREFTSKGEDMRSEKYKTIMDASATDELAVARRTFYLAYMKHFQEALDKLPQNVADSMLGKTARIKGNLTSELKANSNGAKELWARTVRSVKDFTETTTRLTRVNIDENGNIVSSIPIMYTGSLRSEEAIKKLEDERDELKRMYANTPQANSEKYNAKLLELESRIASLRAKPTAEELSFDMVGTLLKFSAMAENYEVMSAIEDTMIAFQKVIEKRQYTENSSKIKKIARSVKGKLGKDVYMKKRSNVELAAEKFMEMVFYDEEDVTKGMFEKAVDKLLSYTSLSYVAFNVFGNFNNYLLGRLNNGVEVLGQRFFSRDAYIRASKEFNKRALSDLVQRASYNVSKVRISGAFDPYKPISKYEAFVDLFRMMDTKGDIRESAGLTDKVGKSYFDKFVEFGYSFQDAAEYNVQTKVGMAILMDTFILNQTTGEIISLYDAFEFNGDQELELKDGFTTIVKPKKEIPTFKQALKGSNIKRDDKGNMLYDIVGEYNDEFRYNLRYKIREVNKQIHGNYAKEDRMVLQTYTLGKLLAQFHKWVAPAIRARWQSEYFDENLGWMEGRYHSWGQFMRYVFKNASSILTGKQDSVKGFMNSLGFKDDGSQADERILNKVLNMHRVNGEIGMILMLYATVALLRGIWQDDDDSDTIKRLKNLARYQADRARKEMILFTPSIEGGRQVLEFFDSPFAVTRTLGELGGAIDATWDYGKNGAIYLATGNEEDWFYNKDVYYQRGRRTGRLKVNKEWSDVIPILYEFKKWEDYIQLNNFFIK
jgi:primosomal protein N''